MEEMVDLGRNEREEVRGQEWESEREGKSLEALCLADVGLFRALHR